MLFEGDLILVLWFMDRVDIKRKIIPFVFIHLFLESHTDPFGNSLGCYVFRVDHANQAG